MPQVVPQKKRSYTAITLVRSSLIRRIGCRIIDLIICQCFFIIICILYNLLHIINIDVYKLSIVFVKTPTLFYFLLFCLIFTCFLIGYFQIIPTIWSVTFGMYCCKTRYFSLNYKRKFWWQIFCHELLFCWFPWFTFIVMYAFSWNIFVATLANTLMLGWSFLWMIVGFSYFFPKKNKVCFHDQHFEIGIFYNQKRINYKSHNNYQQINNIFIDKKKIAELNELINDET